MFRKKPRSHSQEGFTSIRGHWSGGAFSRRLSAATARMLPLRRYDADIEFVRSRTPQGSVCRDDSNGLPQYWCLERILDSRVQCGCSDDGVIAAQQKEYLCKWFGYGEDHSSWESEAALTECTLHVHKYENRHSCYHTAARNSVPVARCRSFGHR